ncbi:hypothetical protein F4781DRAFT_427415 [Annulohypoxylon bovei var. microspora]|nr:hypothetical protein F4781DRAFT_427415 [Annulohypoxylon bovei var. microspora]
MEREHTFYRIPPEVIVMIYKRMNDIKDVNATLSTCRRAKAIFDAHAGVIAKSHLLRTLDPSNIKLMVMAVASRDVDPTDPASLERFFHSYVWRTDPWPASYFTMDMVVALPWFCKAVDQLFNKTFIGLWRSHFYFGVTPTEGARELRTCLMMETAANLFYRAPGKHGAVLRHTPCGEWVDKYWEVFSHVEVETVLLTADYYRQCFFDSIDTVYIAPRRALYTSYRMNGVLGFTVGLENLYKWTQKLPLGSLPHIVEEFWWSGPEEEEIGTPYHDAKRCLGNKTRLQPRFQPDPDAIDEETWQRVKCEGLKKFFGCGEFDQSIGMLSCWDKATLTRFGEAMRNAHPLP